MYLHDYLAGSAAAVDLLETLSKERAGQPLGQFASGLLAEIETNRDTLRQLADKVGRDTNPLKEAAAWCAEKASRLKLNHDSEEGLGTFEALEFLVLGIQGKLAMWRALAVAQDSDPRLVLAFSLRTFAPCFPSAVLVASGRWAMVRFLDAANR
jgi:hypothetical protein